MKKALSVFVLLILLFNILMLSMSAVTAQGETTEEPESTETVQVDSESSEDEAEDVAAENSSNPGSTIAVFIGAGVAILAGLFVAFNAQRKKPDQQV